MINGNEYTNEDIGSGNFMKATQDDPEGWNITKNDDRESIPDLQASDKNAAEKQCYFRKYPKSLNPFLRKSGSENR